MRDGLSEDLYHRVHEYETVDEFGEREKLAAEYAERFVFSHTEIDDPFWARMKAAFTDKEIVELTATIAFCLGVGRLQTVLDLANECEIVVDG